MLSLLSSLLLSLLIVPIIVPDVVPDVVHVIVPVVVHVVVPGDRPDDAAHQLLLEPQLGIDQAETKMLLHDLTNSFALNFLNFLLYLTFQSGQRRRGQEQEQEQEKEQS